MSFCGGKDEFYVGGRFFEGFEEGIEGGIGKHVDFVDDVDFKACLGGGILAGFAKVADLIDGVIGGTIDFNDIEARAIHD